MNKTAPENEKGKPTQKRSRSVEIYRIGIFPGIVPRLMIVLSLTMG